MKTYSLLPSYIAALRRRSFIIAGVSAVAGLIMWGILDARLAQLELTSIMTVGLVLAMLVFSTYRTSRNNTALWRSIQVELGGNYIARAQLRIPQVRIMRDEVTSIEEISGGLCVRTADPHHSLAIPAQLTDNGYQEICAVLSTWAPIKPKPAGRQWQWIALVAMILAGGAAMLLAPWLWLRVTAGVALTAFNGWYYWQLRQTKGVDPQYRRTMLITTLAFAFLTVMSNLSAIMAR